MANPRNSKQLKEFLDVIGYYRNFLSNYSQLMNPFYQLLKKGSRWHVQSFNKVKDLLLVDMELVNPDFKTPFLIYTDASHMGIGGAICQKKEGNVERVISFASRTLNEHERLYTTSELECLAIKEIQHLPS